MDRWVVVLAVVQGIYFFLTGVWPIVHIRSFMKVTGPKVDLWLVKTVGVVVGVIGIAVGLAGWNGRVTGEIVLLAAGSAGGLMAIDAVYVAKRVIDRIYLVDAVAQALFIAGWVAWLVTR